MGRKRSAARGALVALLAVLVLAIPGLASGHTGDQSYVYLDIYDDTIAGEVQLPIADVNEVLGLSIPEDEAGASAAVEANLATLQAYASEHLGMGDTDGEWAILFDGHSILELSVGSYVVLPFEVDRTFDPVPREFVVFYDALIHALPGRDALLLIATDWQSGTFNNEADQLLRYTPDNTTQLVQLDEGSFWQGFCGTVRLGAEHIRIGTSFGSSLWRVLKIVTMFTVAHTITLTLGGLGIIDFPAALVETVIAVSIALAAIHNIRPIFVNKEWLIAFGFGLFHGLGFAGLLSELGLTQSRRVVSLLGFNLGIELGQVAIIVLLFPALFLLRRTRYYLPVMYIGSVALAAIAIGWAIDRALGIDLRVDAVVDSVLQFPRSLIFITVVYLIAAGVYALERHRGRLLPITAEGGDSEPADDRSAIPS